MDFLAVEQNLRESFRVLASDRPSADVRDVGGVTIASAGVAFQMFNAAFLALPVQGEAVELERRIATAAVHFRARGLDWSFWVCDDMVERRARRKMESIFSSQGMHKSVELPGMAADELAPARNALPPLEIRRVADEPTRLAFCDIGSVCFHVPNSWFREIFLWERLWRDGFTGFVAYRHGEAVATAATVWAGGSIGVYNVATLPRHRRLGIGEAVMRHALDEAARETGCRRSILQSTEYGYRLYQTMGYKKVTQLTVYASDT
ncbi:MAG: GNAT family N-acetyltransferase [Bryobacteraceae bacterium]